MVDAQGIDLYATQQAFKARLREVMPEFQVESGGIPDGDTVIFTKGVLKPYIIINFADLMPTAGDASFGGPIRDGYYSYINLFGIGPSDEIARSVVNEARSRMLGYKMPNASALRMAPGGGVFALPTGRDLPTAFTALAAMRYLTNIDGVGANPYA